MYAVFTLFSNVLVLTRVHRKRVYRAPANEAFQQKLFPLVTDVISVVEIALCRFCRTPFQADFQFDLTPSRGWFYTSSFDMHYILSHLHPRYLEADSNSRLSEYINNVRCSCTFFVFCIYFYL